MWFGQPRKDNLGLQPIAEPCFGEMLVDSSAVCVFGSHVGDADWRAELRRHADDPAPQRELRADPRERVAVAGHRVEFLALAVEQQHHGLWHLEDAGQPLQALLQQAAQVAAARQTLAQLAQAGDMARCALRRRHLLAGHMLDSQYLVNIRAEQAEHTAHASVRGDPGELGLHALEQRPCGFRAPIEQRQTIARAGLRMQEEHRGLRVGQDVLAGLVEELEGQRDMVGVDVMHLGNQGYVWRAARPAGGDRRRHSPLQAGADGIQTRPGRHLCGSRRMPALGPGVCSNKSLRVKLRARSCEPWKL
ncbi:hypothetical protein D9M68_611180 [compost metagenome]